jgi:uncharacterized membrane protein
MHINLLPFTVFWMMLAVAVIGLIVYRAWTAWGEDERLHIHQSETGLVSHQAATAQRLETIDRWGQVLTVIALVFGLAVGAGYVYQNWLAAANGLTR